MLCSPNNGPVLSLVFNILEIQASGNQIMTVNVYNWGINLEKNEGASFIDKNNS